MRLITLVVAALASTAASAQQLGERLPGQRSEAGMPRGAARGDGARPCPHYGPGFVQLQGSTTCVRLGGQVRFEMGAGTARSRDGSTLGTRAGATVELDSRTPTDAGDLRVVVRGRATSDTGVMTGQPWR